VSVEVSIKGYVCRFFWISNVIVGLVAYIFMFLFYT